MEPRCARWIGVMLSCVCATASVNSRPTCGCRLNRSARQARRQVAWRCAWSSKRRAAGTSRVRRPSSCCVLKLAGGAPFFSRPRQRNNDEGSRLMAGGAKEHVEKVRNSKFNRQRAETETLRSNCGSDGYVFTKVSNGTEKGAGQ